MAKQNNDKNIESTLLQRADEDFDVQLGNEAETDEPGGSLQDLLDAQNVDPLEDFGDLETQLELAREAEPTSSTNNTQRNWLIFTALSFLLAILASFIIAPTLSVESQRKSLATEISNAVTVIQSSANQALSPAGSFASLRDALASARSNTTQMVSKQSVAKTLASGMFGHTLTDAQISSDWEAFDSAVQNLVESEAEVNNFKSGLEQLDQLVSQSLNDSVTFVEAVAQEGQSRSSASDKNRYLTLSKEASDIVGILSRLSIMTREYSEPRQNLVQLANQQSGLVLRLNETLAQIESQAASGVRTLAEPLQAQFNQMEEVLADLRTRAQALSNVGSTITTVSTLGDALNAQLVADAEDAAMNESTTTLGTILPIVLALLGGFGLLRYSQSQTKTITERDEGLSQTVAQQQDSILKLLDEMSSLADGDLTIEAEVTDQITGAIADSVNFAVIEMRQLVAQINNASLQVAQESETAVENANLVSVSNREQAQRITSAAELMTQVAEKMRQMSEQANSSSKMAQESIHAATQGTQAVRDTIRGMEDMREQIQDTSKRIKRLGESSQRIGDIVALIDDIAEQTNILSLNAAIQASMAGEAGRGFAVVSNEVQNLAERSTEATKRIAELVKTIQNDTNDAVLSMEKATQQVVAGTKVADSAGTALAEIDSVSKRLSELILLISEGSNEQAQMVSQVSEQVSEVSQSSSDTSVKAQESATSIAKLLELSRELETSVSRFKLPVSNA